MTREGVGVLWMAVVLCLAGPPVVSAQVVGSPPQSVGMGIRPDGSRDVLSPASALGRSGGWRRPEPDPPAKACRAIAAQAASITSRPEAADPTALTILKSWVSGAWQLILSWTGTGGPFTVSYSTEPSFQNAVQTLEQGTTSTGLTRNADTSKNLECFEVTDASVVSEPVQGMGYDPAPAPTVPTFTSVYYWWGQDVTLHADYLDPIPPNNVTFFYDLPIRAHLATPIGNGFASDATFTIPDDSRSAYMYVQAHGRTSPPSPAPVQYLRLSPPNIGPYTNIRGLSYARATGNVWVAADGLVQEANIFLRIPATGVSFTDLSMPYISRVTSGGKLMVIDGTNGVAEIFEVDVSTGARTHYAYTHDSGFTRDIWPSGIAADPDGSACYVADYNGSRVVKVPAGAGGGSTIVDTWGNRTFSFPDPCGMDVNVGHQVVVGTASWQTWLITGPVTSSFQYYTNSTPNSIELDRDVATSSWSPWVYSDAAFCEAFNQNTFTTPAGATAPARYHGAGVWADNTNGVLVLTPDWTYAVYHHYPQKVIINNGGQNQVYPSPWQQQDRIVRLDATGWYGGPLQLRLIDPSDVSGYAPDGGFPSQYNTPVPPYEANDDYGPADPSTNTDYGLTFNSDGSGATTTPLIGYPDSNFNLTFYLKVPARYSGDNYQVEVTKCALGSPPTPLPQRIPFLSSAYTSWKRVYVERDHMFRRGGVLYSSFNHTTCGSSCNQIVVYDWVNASVNDSVVIFDEANTYEAGGEARTISGISNSSNGVRTITLNANLTKDYLASDNDGQSPPHPSFGNGHSGGLGVTYSTIQDPPNSGLTITDTSSNQINGTGSAFYDPDIRDVEQPYDEACIELYGQRIGMGAVPYLPDAWFGSSTDRVKRLFHQLWFANKAPQASPNQDLNNPHNYFHLLGASKWSISGGVVNGKTYDNSDVSFVFLDSIATGCTTCTPSDLVRYRQETADHELAHQFRINGCDGGGHDDNNAWCGSPGGQCANSINGFQYCIMHNFDPTYSNTMRSSGINHLDCDDLAAQGPTCGDPSCAQGISVRTDTDPE